MKHLDWTIQFRAIYDKALSRYKAGSTDWKSWFTPADLAFLDSIGARGQDFLDYVEDFTRDGQPDFETTLLIQAVRRDYLWLVQGGKSSSKKLAMTDYPAKTDAVDGIPWLPRIILKARTKLRGEMPDDMMYGCGGDRNFFHTHDIHPAEFLRVVWMNEGQDRPVIDFVKSRSSAK